MFQYARFPEPLLSELSMIDTQTLQTPLPKSLQRDKPLALPNIEEPQVMRHFLRLSQMNYGVDTGMYPLGSCTMKYNPKLSERISSWDQFTMIHPEQDPSTIQGSLQIIAELEHLLSAITGMDQFTLQPAAGAQGEFTGLLLTRAYHNYHNDTKRTEVILPDTSHGTNPASVTLAGYHIIEIPSGKEGTVDLDALEKALSEKTACFMLTNPNTLGIFESEIAEIARMVHQQGALLYYDGANMNAILGKTRPGDMGFDIVHVNLHKTFSTPHGGGGPGAGPIGVQQKLEPFLPIPRIIKQKKQYHFSYDHPHSIGKIAPYFGNFGVLLRAYVYIHLMGSDGLKEAAEIAVLNANYMKKKLVDSKKFDLPFKDLRKHEFVLSCKRLKQERNIRALDVAKRLLDYGFHPPTIYFPLLVKEALMIEPTESENKETLDRYIDALIRIAEENSEIVADSPKKTSVFRVDEAAAGKNPILNWQEIEKSS